MLLTDAAGDPGSDWDVHADPRRNGIRAAIATALQGGLAVRDKKPCRHISFPASKLAHAHHLESNRFGSEAAKTEAVRTS